MYTILEESVSELKLSNFRTFRWRSSNYSSNTLTETFWSIRSNFRMHTFVEYLKMKAILGNPSMLEMRMLYDAPGVLSDNLFIDALRAQQSGVQLNILLQRLAKAQQWLQRRPWSLNLLYTYTNVVAYEIVELRKTIRKVKKYSGYVRNPSAVGTKKGRKPSSTNPETVEWNSYVDIDWYEFLTVGKFSGPSLEIALPEETEISRNGFKH
jgi:hypothetical protein